MLSYCFTLLGFGLLWGAVGQNILIPDTLEGDELAVAQALGFNATVVTEDQWRALNTSDFASYDALVLGDPFCGYVQEVTFINESREAWSPAVTGNVIIMGTDPSYHYKYGGVAGAGNLIKDALHFVVNQTGTGLYYALSCYYAPYDVPVLVESLAEFGSFYSGAADACDDAHIVASSEALNGLSDSDLSDWGCSVHEIFTQWPSNFSVLAIMKGASIGSQTFADNSTGAPYILARGVTPVSCGNGIYEPQYGEQCDDGDENGTTGDLCSSECKCIYGVLNNSTGTCNSPPISSTSTSSSSTSVPSSSTSVSSSLTSVSTSSTGASTSSPTSTLTLGSTTSASSTTAESIATTSSTITTSQTTVNPISTSSISLSTDTSAESTSRSSTTNFPTFSFTNSSVVIPSTLPPSETSSTPLPTILSSDPPQSTQSTSASVTISSVVVSPAASSLVSSIATASASATATPFPNPIDAFALLGCMSSQGHYSSYTLALSSEVMTLDLCVSQCGNAAYAGVYNTDCYCADSNGKDDLVTLPSAQCSLPCPGDATERCGGNLDRSPKRRRQVGLSASTVLTIYQNTAVIPVVISSSGTVLTTTITPGVTSTATSGIVISSGISQSASVPSAVSSHAAGTSISISVSASVSTTNTYVFKQYTGVISSGQILWVLQPCSCVGGYAYVPISCGSGACQNTAVYTPIPSSASTPAGATIYQPQACGECAGGVKYVQSSSASDSTASSGALPTAVVVAGGTTTIVAVSSRTSPIVTTGGSTTIVAGTSKPSTVATAGANNVSIPGYFAALVFGTLVLLI